MIHAVGVVVPVHDEELLLGKCLRSLQAAARRARAHADVRVVIVLDACSDESPEIAADFASTTGFDVLSIEERNVGRARAIGIDHLLDRFRSIDRAALWIATTDADSMVPKSWLTDHLAIASRGADAMTGVVRVRGWHPFARPHMRAFQKFYATFGGIERHGHVHGANLGVRASAYLEVGGFPALRTGEDQALVRALREAKRDVVATRQVEVRTSGRLAGRAPHGFAEFLATIAERVPTTL